MSEACAARVNGMVAIFITQCPLFEHKLHTVLLGNYVSDGSEQDEQRTHLHIQANINTSEHCTVAANIVPQWLDGLHPERPNWRCLN